MKRLRWIVHPITIFAALQVVWLATLLIWVIWFVGQQEAIAIMARTYGGEYFDSRVTLTILVIGCVLLGVICVGTIVLFVLGQRQIRLARQQRGFVSSVTHELKSPLASLQLSLETMGTHRLDETTTRRLMDMAQTDIDRLRRLVDQILVAGQFDRGVLSFEDKDEDVTVLDLIRRICGKLSYLDPRLPQRVVINVPPELRTRVSRTALTLILNNLVENAVKYSPRAAPIEVTASVVDGQLVLAVTDKGMGFDPKEKRRLFRMFQRGEAAIRRAIPGTGLGLYIVQSAVRLLGGRIDAESPGRDAGSTFRVTLPTTPLRTGAADG